MKPTFYYPKKNLEPFNNPARALFSKWNRIFGLLKTNYSKNRNNLLTPFIILIVVPRETNLMSNCSISWVIGSIIVLIILGVLYLLVKTDKL